MHFLTNTNSTVENKQIKYCKNTVKITVKISKIFSLPFKYVSEIRIL